MNAFLQHLAFEVRTGVRNRWLLFLNYALPWGFYLFLSTVMVSIDPGYRQNLIPVMVIFATLTGAVLGLPNPLVEAREAGVFRAARINGVPSVSLLAIPALGTTLHLAVTWAFIALTAPLLFRAAPPGNLAAFVLVCLLAAWAYTGLGLVIAVISANARVTPLWTQLVYLPSLLLGGLMIPPAVLPISLRRGGMLLPAWYAMDAFETLTWPPVVVLFAGGMVAYVLAVHLFAWDAGSRRPGRLPLAALALLPYLAGMLLTGGG